MDLVKAARRGDEAAFLRIFDEHRLPLFRFAYRLTGSTADAEDVAQECFLELLRPGCAFDPMHTPLRTYLFGVVRNQCLKRLRKMGRVHEGEDIQAQVLSPEVAVLHGEMETAVAQAVERLPETQRSVLILAHYEQLPIAEIAGVMDLDVGAVKSRLQRARANLKETLAVYAPDPERKR